MQNVTIKIDKLIGTLVVVGSDLPTEEIQKKVEEAILKSLSSATSIRTIENDEYCANFIRELKEKHAKQDK